MDFNPFKPMNIVLTNDSIRRVPIGYIPYVPDVQIAWAKAGHALIGALLGGSLVALPVAAGLIRYFNRNGAAFMEERHERGAMLVERHLLVADILTHNRRAFEENARKLFPDLTANAVSALPFGTRKRAGLHHPYSLGGVPFPYGLEQSHTIIVGTTGSGKTTQLKSIVAEMRARGDSAVVFDLTGSFIESFYDPKSDIILNPGDERCPCWSVFEDCTTEAEFTAASQALIPHDGGGSDPFWVATARLLFVQMCMKLQQHGLTTNSALADNLVKADLKRLHRILKDTAAGVAAAKHAQAVKLLTPAPPAPPAPGTVSPAVKDPDLKGELPLHIAALAALHAALDSHSAFVSGLLADAGGASGLQRIAEARALDNFLMEKGATIALVNLGNVSASTISKKGLLTTLRGSIPFKISVHAAGSWRCYDGQTLMLTGSGEASKLVPMVSLADVA